MQESGYNRSRRAAAGIMIVLMLVVLLLSACCFVAEADHDCAGEDCPGLHTAAYRFPDAVIAPAVDAFAALLGIA